MRLLMIAVLYLAGALIDGLWWFGRKEDFDEVVKVLLNDESIQFLPERLANIAVAISIGVVCLEWPVTTVRRFVSDIKGG